jgi:hypothetical protein
MRAGDDGEDNHDGGHGDEGCFFPCVRPLHEHTSDPSQGIHALAFDMGRMRDDIQAAFESQVERHIAPRDTVWCPGVALADWAALTEQWDVMETLIARGAAPTLFQLMAAATCARPHCGSPASPAAAVRALARAGLDVNAADANGVTALHMAALPDTVDALLASGAVLEAADGAGNTAVATAASLEVYQKLRSHGAAAAPDAVDDVTPLRFWDTGCPSAAYFAGIGFVPYVCALTHSGGTNA